MSLEAYLLLSSNSTVCPTRYQTRHFFNNFTTNEDIATATDTHYRHTADTHYRHTHYRHTLQTHCRHTLQTHTTDTHTTDTLQTHTLQTHTTDTHTTDTHYRHIPLHFSYNERTPAQISLQYLHLC